jgi:oxygen-independent coproporphyrinogen-3 oxidase
LQKPEEAYELWLEAVQRLNAHGYQPYTVTCFAKPGKESKYILGAWQAPQLEVLGCGAGAISSAIREHTYINISGLEDYIKTVNSGRLPVMVGKKMSAAERMSRYIILGLRTLELNKDKFFELFGCHIDDVYAEQLEYLRQRQLIVDDEHTLRLSSPRGIWYAGNVSKQFFTPNNVRKPQPVGPLYAKVALPKAVSESSLRFDQV